MPSIKECKEGDIIGDNITFIRVLSEVINSKSLTLFRCHCGKEFKFQFSRVSCYEKHNCGCGITLKIERKMTKKEIPGYQSWGSMKDRCYNPNSKDYHRYGAKGIIVCDRWLEPNGQGFLNFLEDMGERPEGKYSLDRKDGTKGYYPENCRWATYIEQNNNLSSNRQLTYKGKTMLRIEWVELLGINESTFDNYLIRHGNDMEAIISEMKSKGLQLNYP